MQSIINLGLLRLSVSARVAAFRPFEHPYQKFVYTNLTSFTPYPFKDIISS